MSNLRTSWPAYGGCVHGRLDPPVSATVRVSSRQSHRYLMWVSPEEVRL